MFANSYVGIVHPQVPCLIASRARRLGAGRDDIDDLQQQIVPLVASWLSSARSGGVTPTSVGLIDRQIRSRLRAERRYRRRVDRLSAAAQQDASLPARPEHAPSDLRLDLERALASLLPRDREICRHLSQELSVCAIAQRLGCSRGTVQRAIARIRKAFDAAGLRAWIDPDPSGAVAHAGRTQQ